MNVKELLIVVLVCLVGYGIYVVVSLLFSAFNKGRGYDKFLMAAILLKFCVNKIVCHYQW